MPTSRIREVGHPFAPQPIEVERLPPRSARNLSNPRGWHFTLPLESERLAFYPTPRIREVGRPATSRFREVGRPSTSRNREVGFGLSFDTPPKGAGAQSRRIWIELRYAPKGGRAGWAFKAGGLPGRVKL